MYKDRQPRIVLVTRETRMDGVLKRWSNRGLARHVLKQRKVDFAVKGGNLALADDAELAGEHEFLDLEQEDTTYRTAIHELARSLDFDIPFQTLPRDYLPTYDFERCAVVVVAGQDGLVANTAKYVGSVPIVGVNPDPEALRRRAPSLSHPRGADCGGPCSEEAGRVS